MPSGTEDLVDLIEVFPFTSVREQMTEGGWEKSICLLESGKVVSSWRLRCKLQREHPCIQHRSCWTLQISLHHRLWQLSMDLPEPKMAHVSPPKLCLGALEFTLFHRLVEYQT